MKIQSKINKSFSKKPSGTLKSGTRLDDVLDFLTSAQAAGAPDGANVTVSERYIEITWEEER